MKNLLFKLIYKFTDEFIFITFFLIILFLTLIFKNLFLGLIIFFLGLKLFLILYIKLDK